ncbi:MAG: hypothetical protein K0S10_444 [Rubrobacteraceae bacterium]|jgi:hypothetical protein|nr:hypothetical protein [Rubrobacteraceae bacterium]
MSRPAGSQGGISRVIVRYSDGRVLNFVADARRPIFSEDDLLELKKIISRASSAAEWADINTRLGF